MKPSSGDNPALMTFSQRQRRGGRGVVDTRYNHPRDIRGASKQIAGITSIELEVTVCIDPRHGETVPPAVKSSNSVGAHWVRSPI